MSVENLAGDAAAVDVSDRSISDLMKMLDGGGGVTAPTVEPTEAAEPVAGEPPAAEPKAESAPAAEPVKPNQETDDEQNLPAGLKKRFKTLTGEIRDLRAQLAATAKPPAAEGKPGVAPPPADANVEPKAEQFDTYEAYVAALTRFELQKSRTEEQANARQERLEREWSERSAAARTRYADFDDVTDADLPISRFMHEAILSDAHGAELAYWLGKNPSECARIAALPFREQVVEVARIEATFKPAAGTPEPQKPPVSQAPKPPTLVKPSAGVVVSQDLNDPNLSMADFKRIASGQLRKKPNF
jgi:hypothetical protein